MEDSSTLSYGHHSWNDDVGLEEVIHFLQQNLHYLQNEVNPYSVDKLMMLLDNDKLSALEEEFNEHPNGIELSDFVLLLKSTIVHPNEDKFKLISGLIKLFQDIDINGDGHMEWSEFTQYIIDAVIGEKDTKFFDARFEKDRELTEHEILDKAYSRKTKRYVMSKIVDNTIHLNLIKKICYCAYNDHLALLEQGAKKIKMYTNNATLGKEHFEPIFEEKAFILDFCYAEKPNMIGCIASDRRVLIWENTPSKREVANVKHDVLPTGIWYLENHKVWIIAGADNGLRTFTYGTNDRNQGPSDKPPLLSHTKKITEVTEISIPKLVASSSLDGTIKLWDLADRTLITELRDKSTVRGIRGITYSFDYGGNLLSFGFESYINIWCPEVSLTRSYVGKLEGHSHAIVCCKFIPGSPNCVSVDEKGNIRIWDIRTLTTIQLISAENSSIVVTELTIIPKHDKFVLGGKRMTFYDNSAISKSIKHFNDDLYPIYCSYNQYYHTMVVLTKIDLRIYDVLSGKLKKVFTDLTDERFNTSDLSSFAFGGKQRKFYIGDNSGYVRVYNMKNGEFIHKINKFNEEQELDKKKELEKKKAIKKRENAEVSQIIYLNDEKLLITASWDSTIRIYDESEADESILLRIMSGGHRDSDINTMTYSPHLNLLASGSGNGLIAVWDLELGKLEHICLGHTAEITSLQFAEPFPILISGSADGTICIWGVRPCVEIYRHKCILRLINSIWKEDGSEARLGITNLMIETDSKVITKRKSAYDDFPNPAAYRDYILTPKKPEPKTGNNLPKGSVKILADSEDKEKSYFNANNEEAKGLDLEFLDEVLYCPLNKPHDSMDESLDDYAKYRETFDVEQKSRKKGCYVYYTDQKGYVNLLDLTEVLKKREIGPCKTEKKTDSYQLRRKEWIDVSKLVDTWLSNEKLRKAPYTVHTFNSVLINRWEAHSQGITSFNKIEAPRMLITCSLDKYVKVWSMEGDLHGAFNLVKLGKRAWEFPFDWVRHRLKEVDDAFEVLDFIEKEEMQRLQKKDKDRIKLQYLTTSFGSQREFVNAVKNFRNNKGFVEKKSETPIKERDVIRKDIEIPAFLQIESEEKDRNREKDKNKSKLKNKGNDKGKDNLDLKESMADLKKSNMADFKGLAQRVFVSLEKYEKEGKKDSKKEVVGLQHQPSRSISKPKTEGKLKTIKSKNLETIEMIIKGSLDERKKAYDKSHLSSRVGSAMSKRFVSSTQNFKQQIGGPNLPAIDGINEEEMTIENQAPRNKVNLGGRALSAKPFFGNLSSKALKKNLDHATNLMKNHVPTLHHKSPEPEDIKFRQGEGLRSLKIATRKQIDKFESDSPKMFALEREALASRSEFYRNLRANNVASRGEQGNASGRSTAREDYKIIANRIFMEDPDKNKMKVLKSNNSSLPQTLIMEDVLRSPVLATFPPAQIHNHSHNSSLNMHSHSKGSSYSTAPKLHYQGHSNTSKEASSNLKLSNVQIEREKNSSIDQLQPTRNLSETKEYILEKENINLVDVKLPNSRLLPMQMKTQIQKDAIVTQPFHENQENVDPLKVSLSSATILQQNNANNQQLKTSLDQSHDPSTLQQKQKMTKRFTIHDVLLITRRSIDFGTCMLGQIKEESFEVTNRSNQNILLQIEVDCFNPELQETEEYVYSLRRSNNQDYNDRHYIIMTGLSTASFKMALKVPLVKSASEIVGETKFSVQGLQGVYCITMQSNIITPKITCPKILYNPQIKCEILKLAVRKGKKQEAKIPLKNESDIPLTIELGFYTPRHIELERKYCCLIYPNIITLPPQTMGAISLYIKDVSGENNDAKKDHYNSLEVIKEVLVGRVADSAVFYSFALSVDLY